MIPIGILGIAHRVGKYRTVGFGDRHEHIAINNLVEVEDRPVGILERVVEFLLVGGGAQLWGVRLRRTAG